MNSKPPTTPLGIVACTLNFSDNLSGNSCVEMKNALMRGRKTNSNTNIEDNTCCSSPLGAYLFQAHLRGAFFVRVGLFNLT